MGVVYYLMERLRQLVGSCWDYCVIWKLSEDPWSLLECVDCCCGGSYQKSEEEEGTAPLIPCKDAMFQHPRMRCCELLSQLPPSLPLDGINAEVLMSNQPRWLKNAKISDLATTAEEMIESKVLIPVPGGLVEFYASKMVPEDQSLIDYVVGQCSVLSEQGANSSNVRQLQSAGYSPSTALASLSLSCADATADRIRICNSAMSFLQQFSYLAETPRGGKEEEEEEVLVQQQAEGEEEEGPAKPESGSDSEEEDESKYSSRRKSGKGTSKNLMAERKRRKKLNERLYTLRSLVPKISKLDRAAILGDAIDYVMELQQQEKELQNELQQDSEDEGVGSSLVSQHHTPGPMDYSNLMPADNYYDDTVQQMEVQVEVAHLDGNEFFIKVFGEHKGVGFVRLMEALHSLGLEITTVNMTSCISLVSYVFTVENKDNEMVQAEYLRDSLLEMTRNQTSEWPEMAKAQGAGTSHHHPDQYQQQHYFHQPHFHHFQ